MCDIILQTHLAEEMTARTQFSHFLFVYEKFITNSTLGADPFKNKIGFFSNEALTLVFKGVEFFQWHSGLKHWEVGNLFLKNQ